MHITSLRFGLTRNLGNYESAKVEVELIPGVGQTATECLAQAHVFAAEYVNGVADTNIPKGVVVSSSETKPAPKSEKPAEEKPKKRKRGRPRKNPPKTEESKPDLKVHDSDDDEVPFDTTDDDPRAALPKSDSDSAAEYDKLLRYAGESESLEELLHRFNDLRDWTTQHSVEGWEKDCKFVAQRYKELNTPQADPDTQAQCVAAFKAERNYLDDRRKYEASK